jgi:hypothetical protein
MITEAFLKRVLMFIGVILSGLITLIFVSAPEPFQVPVVNELPQITTKSAQIKELEIAKEFFGKPIETTLSGSTLSSLVSWSPNGKYVLANVRFGSGDTVRTQPYVLDMLRRLYVAVPDARWIDTVSWAGTKLAYEMESGYGVFDVATGEANTFGTTASYGPPPKISFDATKVAYANKGVVLYSLLSHSDTRITSTDGDVPAVWFLDNKRIVFARNSINNKSAKSDLYTYDIRTKIPKKIATFDKPFKRAEWVERDSILLLTLGYDDGNFEYLYNVDTGDKKFIAETSEGRAFTSVGNGSVAVVEGKLLSLYDKTFTVTKSTTLTEKGRINSMTLLSKEKVVIVRDAGVDVSSVSLFDFNKNSETALDTIWLPYVVSAPDGLSLATVARGNQSAQFIDVPKD